MKGGRGSSSASGTRCSFHRISASAAGTAPGCSSCSWMDVRAWAWDCGCGCLCTCGVRVEDLEVSLGAGLAGWPAEEVTGGLSGG